MRSKLHKFLSQIGATLDFTSVPPREGWGPGASHYSVTLTVGGESLTTPYSQGCAITTDPDIGDVFHCLMTDAISADQSYEDWAGGFGYNADGGEYRSVYEACVQVRVDMEHLLGERWDAATEACEDY